MRLQVPSSVAAVLASILVLTGLGGPPRSVWAAPAPRPEGSLWTASADAVVEPHPYYVDELDANDYHIPDWMRSAEYLNALPEHGFRRKPSNRHSPEFETAYAFYVDEMTERGGPNRIATADQFWLSFFPGGWNHLLTGWRDYQGTSGWTDWLDTTVSALNAGRAGAAFEGHYNSKNKIDKAAGFLAINQKVGGVNLTWKEGNSRGKEAGSHRGYRVDSYHPLPAGASRGVVGERKSGSSFDSDELMNVTVEVAAILNADIEITFGEPPSADSLKILEKAGAGLLARRIELHGEATGSGTRPIQVKTWRAEVIVSRPASTVSLVAGAQQPWRSTAATKLENSARSAAAAKEDRKIRDAVADDLVDSPSEQTSPAKLCQLDRSPCHSDVSTSVPAVVYDDDEIGDNAEGLGGVDFSTLELRYISDTFAGAPGVRYSYSVDPDSAQQVSYGGADAARLASDSFFTWLALPESAFTVNLNPEEPNRIVDARFGRTDAGRVLLEADLQMKKTAAKLIHPNTTSGKRFWRDLRGKRSCINLRQWIVPAPATVRDAGNELFILDAPLQVMMETQDENRSGAKTCPGQATADTEHNENVYREQILPQIVTAVNTAAGYADLRRVYASRVAAQWYRKRSQMKNTAYGDIVDSGDITPWVTRNSWKPKDTFDAYVKSYKKGQFRVKHTARGGTTISTTMYLSGGVDFTAASTSNLPEAAFEAKRPGLRTVVADLGGGPVADKSGTLWFGQESNELPRAQAYAPPPSPLSNPWFYALSLLPLLAWATAGILLVRRRRGAVAR